MKLATRSYRNRTETLETYRRDAAILWFTYPNQPLRDIGWRIPKAEIDKTIAARGLTRLAVK